MLLTISKEQYNNLPEELQCYFTEFKNNHPTIKNLKLMEYLIKMVTPKGGTVLDPFMGSGSTGCACVKNGYDYIGIELTEEYIPIIEARIKYYQNNKTILYKENKSNKTLLDW